MSNFDWSYHPSGLGIRKDEFSWQGSYKNDQHFFLRRSLYDFSSFTDFLVGNQSAHTSATLFSEFLWRTGGINTEKITLNAIASRQDNPDIISSCFDCKTGMAKKALEMLGVATTDSYLQENGSHWDVVLRLSVPGEPASLKI